LQNDSCDTRSDQDLIAATNDCDPRAFEALYFRYRDWVVNLAFRFTGDRDLALDVLQDTFLYFLKKFPGFVLTCQLRSFLYPVVRNLAIAARRKAQRYQSDGTALEGLVAPIAPGTGFNPREDLTAAMSDLSTEHREVLLLRFVDGLSLNEIAEVMNIPLGTVKSRMHHALASLREDERVKKFLEP
jgi:RNA polymerase sigma-70 factor (ECF subfamily)